MQLKTILPLLFTAIGLGAMLWGAYWFLIGRHADLGKEHKFPRQLVLLGLTLFSLIVIILVLPINDKSRNQLIGLIGLLVSGIFAFSSTTVIANLMAGILLRVTKPFQIGDFISVRDYFGRVAERGLFDTEIQSENRELIAIPNTFLISNPVSTVHRTGAIVSASLSLGYDVHHSQVESLLVKAAEKSGLDEPFVHILELGNYSITYRVSGVLAEVKGLITARSNLRRAVLEMLHGQGIEIMSPSFMNQRRLAEDQRIIPTPTDMEPSEKPSAAEEIVFDKAEQAEQIDKEKKHLIDNIQQLEKELKEAPDLEKKRLKEAIEEIRERLKALEQIGTESIEGNGKDEPGA